VFKAFDRLPGEDNRAPPPTADVLRVSSWRDLPPRMRTLGPTGRSESGLRIAYPAPESRIELGPQEAVPLSANGGSGTLRWLVDGRPIDGNRWLPYGTGEARVAVVDEAGHSSAVTVRIVRRQ
jgi:penicillin-binding protein 1C